MKVLVSERTPEAIGPYVLGREFNGICYFSGQIALDRQTNQMKQGSLEEEIRQVFYNMECMLKDNGLNFENVLKTTVFLVDMADFQEVNAIYATYFKAPFPARSCVAVKALPKGARVEIEVVAGRS